MIRHVQDHWSDQCLLPRQPHKRLWSPTQYTTVTKCQTHEIWRQDLNIDSWSKSLAQCILILSLRFNGHFPGEPGLTSVYWWWKWWWQLELQVVQSSSQIITTNKPTPSLFTGRMPFLSPNQQCQSTEGKISHPMDLLSPNSPGGSSNFVSDH